MPYLLDLKNQFKLLLLHVMYGLCMENMLKIIVNQSKQIFSTIRKYLIFILKCLIIGVRGKVEKI